MLEQSLEKELKQAMVNKDVLARDVLRLVKGTIQQQSAVKTISEVDKVAIVRKIIKSNNQSLEAIKENGLLNQDVLVNDLTREISVLKTLLPGEMNEEQIKSFLAAANIDVKSFKNDGTAIGAVMKALKETNASVDNDFVRKTVCSLRVA